MRAAFCLALVLFLAGCAYVPMDRLTATDIFTGGGRGGAPAVVRTPTPGENPAQRIAQAEGDIYATQTAIAEQQRQAQNAEQQRNAGYTATAFSLAVADYAPVQTAGAAVAQVMVEQAHLQETQMVEQATAAVSSATEQAGFERQQQMAVMMIEQDNARIAGERIANIWTVLLYATIALALVIVVSICVLIGDRLTHRKRMSQAAVYKAQAEADQLDVMYTDQHTLVKDGDGVWQIVGERPPGQRPTANRPDMATVRSGPQMGRLTLYVHKALDAVGPDANYFPSAKEMKERSDAYWGIVTDALVENDLLPEKRKGVRTMLHPGWTLRRLLAEVVNLERRQRNEQDLPTEADEVANAVA